MIEFTAIMTPVVATTLKVEAVGEFDGGPQTVHEMVAIATETKLPPFALEATTVGMSKPARSRSRHIGPPTEVRIVTREEVQLTLGL